MFLDEEPALDVTDVNALHVLGLCFAAYSCIIDNALKAMGGLGAQRDRVVFAYVSLKSLALNLYFVLIWGVFFAHSPSPLLGDNAVRSSLIGLLASVALCGGLFGSILLRLAVSLAGRGSTGALLSGLGIL